MDSYRVARRKVFRVWGVITILRKDNIGPIQSYEKYPRQILIELEKYWINFNLFLILRMYPWASLNYLE